MANICIVEDDSNHAFTLQEKVKAIGHSVHSICTTFEEVIQIVQENSPDLILLDINLQTDYEGIHIAQVVRRFSSIPIIYTTALSDHEIVQKAIKVHPSGYLVKPILQETLQTTIALALQKSTATQEKHTNTDAEFLTVRIGYKLRKINLKDIKLLKITSKNYVTLVDKNNKEFQLRNSLKSLVNSLNSCFIQIHRWYGINLNYIVHIDEKEQMLCLQEQIYLPIGRTFKENLYKRLNIM
ncbi:MAG: response regulator transcription factor [Bacteroidota bacterium]